jgi:hypothetical protein
MTAEITLMNKLAIAMAADSAMTITQARGDRKIYNTVNKLFALSKYQPVGVMVYQDAELMDAPWETIIKQYRSELGPKTFGTIEGYCTDFIQFFERENLLFPSEQQDLYFRRRVNSIFHGLTDKIARTIDSLIKEKKSVEVEQVSNVVAAAIGEKASEILNSPTLSNFPDDFPKSLLGKYRDQIDVAIKDIFEELPLTDGLRDNLRIIATNIFSRAYFTVGFSGIVIAGFGDKEMFPALRSYTFEGVLQNKLKYRLEHDNKIDFRTGAWIIPFAQTDMVHTFLRGIDPSYQWFVSRGVPIILEKFADQLIPLIENMDKEQEQRF